MSKHTPGPWGIRIATSTADRHIHARDTLIAVVPYRENNAEERSANARLIAASPDLLAIAKEANEFIDELCMALAKRGILAEKLLPESRRMDIGTGLWAAIAKAEVMP